VPRNATTGSGGRYYTWRKEKFWSVTTLISQGLPKGEVLVNWAKKFTAEYACANIEQLNALLKPNADGKIDRQGAIDWLKEASFRSRDRAADIGSKFHEAAESYKLGKPRPPWPEEIRGRMAAFDKWLADFKPEFKVVEASVYNRSEHYAGTMDAIVTLKVDRDALETVFAFDGGGLFAPDIDLDADGGLTLLVDYKTSKTGIYPEVGLQLCAYRNAEFIAMPDGTEVVMPKVHGCAALHIKDMDDPMTDPDKPYDFIGVVSDDEVFRAFQYCRENFRWREQLSKRVLGGHILPGLPASAAEQARVLDLEAAK
jgi:hypothetical protein